MIAMKLKHMAICSNDLRLKKNRVKYDLCKHYYTNRAINIWNGLAKPNCVVCLSDTLNTFKNKLNKFWQDLLYSIFTLKFKELEAEVVIRY